MTRRTSQILALVADAYYTTPEKLVGPDRHKSISHARLVAYYLLRKVCGYSYPEIGIEMKRDHSTIMHGEKKIARLVDEGTEQHEVERIRDLYVSCKTRDRQDLGWLQRNATPLAAAE